MTTITTNDIRTELEATEEEQHEPLFDFASMTFGRIRPVYAVVGKANVHYPEDRESGIFGLYESEDDAATVAARLKERADARKRQADDLPESDYLKMDEHERREFWRFEFETWSFFVKKLYINDSPVNEYGYVEAQLEF